jgi:NhaA family Na+:H+ antiporter
VLLAATVVALVWANTPARDAYEDLWHTDLTLGAGSLAIREDLRHWVNDALMALFFFVVGLEIKRELVAGELRDRRAAALPAMAAVGGVMLPAAVFLAIIGGGEAASGWAIPMATDIAFAVGVLALLGDRVSDGVKLLLLAIAVVDDIIAITVIAIFYAEAISPAWLAVAASMLALIVVQRRLGLTRVAAYIPAGVMLWVATHESGVHATVAGVALGLLTPTGEVGGRQVLEDLEHRLHHVTSFVAVPLFALANAGVYLGGGKLGDAAGARVAWAIAVGLVLGKLAGIAGATFLGLRAGVGTLPEGVARTQVWGVAALGGVGFTVSLFIAGLAYDSTELQEQAKVGIFAGTLVSGLLGAGMLWLHARRRRRAG